MDNTGNVTGLVGPNGKQFITISGVAPNNADGLADGAVWMQNGLTTGTVEYYAKVGGVYQSRVTTTTPPTVPPSVLKTSGVMRLVGTQNQQAGGAAQTGAYNSAVVKLQAPGGAIGARVIVTNASVSYGMASVKAAMASTDIAACDTVANAYTPMIGGVAQNAISTTTSDKGFVKAKWGGNATSRRLYQSNAVLPSFGYNNQEDIIVSDVIPLVPKRATDRTNEEYYYLLRLTATGTVGQDGQTQIEGGTGKLANVLYNEWLNTSGADSPLICIGGLSNNVDAVDGSLTTLPGGIANGWSPVFHIEWVYPAGVTPVTFWHVGDSITEGYEWPRWAIQRKNTNPLRPLHHVNLGGSTTRTASFAGEMYLHLQALAKPDYILFPIMSVNNYSPSTNFTTAAAATEFANLQEMAQYIKDLGIKLILWTPMNWGANPTDPNNMSTAYNYLYNSIKPWTAANGIYFMDLNGDPRVVRSVYNASTNPTGWIDPDNTHPSNPAGKNGFAAVYSDFLTSIGF